MWTVGREEEDGEGIKDDKKQRVNQLGGCDVLMRCMPCLCF
jgi:hypothetical protein